LAAFALRRFFVVAGALDVARETFALAKAFETSEQLLNGFVTAWFDLNHVCGSSFKKGAEPSNSTESKICGFSIPRNQAYHLIGKAVIPHQQLFYHTTRYSQTIDDSNSLICSYLERISAVHIRRFAGWRTTEIAHSEPSFRL
jgi:hypothetical protein